MINGGEGGIRTHGTENRTLDFESSPFDHSGTSPAKDCEFYSFLDLKWHINEYRVKLTRYILSPFFD